MRGAKRLTALVALGLLAGCEAMEQPAGGQAAAPAASAQPAPAQPTPATETPEQRAAAQAAEDVPRIYMALQPDPSGPTSIIFAIDRGRDETPLNDPAIRLTPEQGQCNPQELRGYPFPLSAARRPVFGPQEALSGISARDLPSFMAMAVTSEMMRQGLVVEPQQSKPQNVCTRKLWERLIINQSAG